MTLPPGSYRRVPQAAYTCRPAGILPYMHDALREDSWSGCGDRRNPSLSENSLAYAGVGNISAALYSAHTSQSLVSHNGTLGLSASKESGIPGGNGHTDAILIMHSDGLQSKWDLSSYAGLLARHAAVIGGALFRDFRRQRDDASVVVVSSA